MAENTYLDVDGATGRKVQKEAVDASAGAGDAGKIPALNGAGKFDPSFFPTGIGPEVRTITASENLAAGDLVNIHESTGFKVRKADATNPAKQADGFVLAAVTSGQPATVWPEEAIITGLSGIEAKTYFLSATAGLFTDDPPAGAGNLVQEIGRGISATEIMFRPGEPVTLAS